MRLSTAVLALVCLVTGSAVFGPRVSAREEVSQPRRFPVGVNIGSRVRLWFPGEKSEGNVDCTIAAIDAGWVRCASSDDPFKVKPFEVWYDLGHVSSVTKVEPTR